MFDQKINLFLEYLAVVHIFCVEKISKIVLEEMKFNKNDGDEFTILKRLQKA